MEPAKVDWKRLEWNFVVDELYEHINAPKWVDFLSPDQSLNDNDDEAWFANLIQRRQRKPKPKSVYSSNQSLEGSNKSSEEKKKPVDDTFQGNVVPSLSLRSTLSAKNLFARRPILNQITEFCNELKKLATRASERENAENLSPTEREEVVEENSLYPIQPLAESDRRVKERKPLFEVGKAERLEGICVKGMQQRKKVIVKLATRKTKLMLITGLCNYCRKHVEAENMPITLQLENARYRGTGAYNNSNKSSLSSVLLC
ncbi:hypothetical protein SESBI_13170 [Sesbania bispinosa]|nr:hypothetical protein SESBI_13170 [Sesbania bispinosa]